MRFVRSFVLLGSLGCVQCVWAGVINLMPPDAIGYPAPGLAQNNGFSAGRGVVFTMSSNTTLASVGTYLDLSKVELSFAILESLPGGYWMQLDSGSRSITSTQPEWIDFAISPLLLTQGQTYQITFAFMGEPTRYFFTTTRTFRLPAGHSRVLTAHWPGTHPIPSCL